MLSKEKTTTKIVNKQKALFCLMNDLLSYRLYNQPDILSRPDCKVFIIALLFTPLTRDYILEFISGGAGKDALFGFIKA